MGTEPNLIEQYENLENILKIVGTEHGENFSNELQLIIILLKYFYNYYNSSIAI